ncbi:MAG TPA: hypothetical protein VHA13_01315 [Gammaproteobacteria bacterium]|nr:hypothetical protein [Gammaproteobacteria bacterium]
MQEGHSNRSAAELTTPEHTALDILNTATATVYGKDINTLLKEHWQNELQYFNEAYKQQGVTATSGNQQNIQIAASSRRIINSEVLIEAHRQLDDIGRINSQATWKTFRNIVTKEVNDQQTTSTSEFIYKIGPSSH